MSLQIHNMYIIILVFYMKIVYPKKHIWTFIDPDMKSKDGIKNKKEQKKLLIHLLNIRVKIQVSYKINMIQFI